MSYEREEQQEVSLAIFFFIWTYSPDHNKAFDFCFYSCLAFILKVLYCNDLTTTYCHLLHEISTSVAGWDKCIFRTNDCFIPWKNGWEGLETSASVDNTFSRTEKKANGEAAGGEIKAKSQGEILNWYLTSKVSDSSCPCAEMPQSSTLSQPLACTHA